MTATVLVIAAGLAILLVLAAHLRRRRPGQPHQPRDYRCLNCGDRFRQEPEAIQHATYCLPRSKP